MCAALGNRVKKSAVVAGSADLCKALWGTISPGSAAVGAPSEVQMRHGSLAGDRLPKICRNSTLAAAGVTQWADRTMGFTPLQF
jgi:hypothetical protein